MQLAQPSDCGNYLAEKGSLNVTVDQFTLHTVWTPGKIGISGNEMKDDIARKCSYLSLSLSWKRIFMSKEIPCDTKAGPIEGLNMLVCLTQLQPNLT